MTYIALFFVVFAVIILMGATGFFEGLSNMKIYACIVLVLALCGVLELYLQGAL